MAAALALVPLVYLLHRSIDAGWDRFVQILGRSDIAALAARSLGLALAVGLLAGLIGTATAWLCEFTDLPGRSLWHVALVAPVAVPSYVAAYAWVSIDRGWASMWGAMIVLTAATAPLVHLHVTASLASLDAGLEEVALSLGWSPAKVSARLVLPQVRRGIASGVLLAMLYVLADFGAVATMRLQVFTWVIHGAYKAGFDPNRAAVLAVVLCAISLALVLIEMKVRGPRSTARVGKGAARQRVPVALGAWAPPLTIGLVAYLGLVLGVPIVRSIQWVMASAAGPTNSGVTTGEFVSAALTTLALGAAVAVVTVGLGLAVAWLNARHRNPASIAVERSILTMHSLPGIVVALSFVYMGTRVLLPLYQRWPMLVLGLVALMGSLAVGPLRTAFEQQPSALTDAAMSTGSSELRAMRRVALPLALPGILASVATIALHSAKELPMTLLLRPSGTDTLATRLWSWAGVSDDASVGPYALALILIAVPPTALMAYRDRRSPARKLAGEWIGR